MCAEFCVCFSPSMDEAATKEELRPVKKQLVRFSSSSIIERVLNVACFV